MAGKIAVFSRLCEQFNKKTVAALIGILVVSSLPIFRGYLPGTPGGEKFVEILSTRWRPMGMEEAASPGLLILFGIQVLTLLVSFLCFDQMPLAGTLLYMLCPYRLYVAYDKLDPLELLVWALLPLMFRLIFQSLKKQKQEERVGTIRRILFGIGGCAIAYLCWWILRGSAVPQDQTFWGGGYVFGQFFTLFSYMEDHPGLGIGALLGTALWFYEGIPEEKKRSFGRTGFAVTAAFLMILSLRRFPWYFVIRLLPGLDAFLAPMGSAGSFAGLLSAVLCFSAAAGVADALEKEEGYRKYAFVWLVIALVLLQGIFMQSEYLYYQYPLE